MPRNVTLIGAGERRKDLWFKIGMGTAAFLWVLPLLWILVMSLTPNSVLRRTTAVFFPSPFTFEHYVQIMKGSHTLNWLINSFVVTISSTVLVLVLASFAGYAFARLEFPFKKVIFVAILAGLAIPEQAVFIPVYTMFADWGLHNSYPGLILPRLATPFGVFMMTQFFKGIPKELEEAALMDNATRWKVFFKIMLPLARPALITLGIFTYLWTWNDYLWPLVSATKTEQFTITTGLASLQTNFAEADGIGSLMAAAVFASLPVLIMYGIFQKYIIRSIAMTTGK